MTQLIDLIEGKPIFLDDRSAGLGGSFYNNPTLMPYSPLPLKWAWEQLIRYPKSVLMDIGASTGCFTLLSRHHPNLEVYSFEPVELTYRVLEANVYLNGLNEKVHLNQVAVSDYDGTGILHTVIADGGKGVSIVDGVPAYHKAVEDSEIAVVTLDRFCALNNISPTMIKIDVEGNELAVLKGARETIEKYKPFLIVEYSYENADQFGAVPRDIIVMIEEWGYTWSNPETTDLWCVPIGWETKTNSENTEKEIEND